jgi:hypothetical protein
VSPRIRLSCPKTLRLIERATQSNPVVHGYDPIRRDVLVHVPRLLIRTSDLEVAALDLVRRPDSRSISINDRHAGDHEIKQRSSFSSFKRVFCHPHRPHFVSVLQVRIRVDYYCTSPGQS